MPERLQLSAEQRQRVAKEYNLDPWGFDAIDHGDEVELVPVETEARGAGEVAARQLGMGIVPSVESGYGAAVGQALAGTRFGRLGGVAGAIAGGISAPIIANKLAPEINEVVGEIVGYPNPVQLERDLAEHPYAAKIGELGSSLAGFTGRATSELGDLISGGLKVTNLDRLAGLLQRGKKGFDTSALGLTRAEAKELTDEAIGQGIGLGMEGINQAMSPEDLDLGRFGLEAAGGLVSGGSRFNRLLQPSPRVRAQTTTAEAARPALTPAEEVKPAEAARPTTAEEEAELEMTRQALAAHEEALPIAEQVRAERAERAKYQELNPEVAGTLSDIEMLQRRGVPQQFTPEIVDPATGQGKAGAFIGDRVLYSQAGLRPDTPVHEGAHAELSQMRGSENPHDVRMAERLLRAVEEEDIARASERYAGENSPLLGWVKDNWAFLKSRLGQPDAESAARVLYSRMKNTSAEARPFRAEQGGEMRGQPLAESPTFTSAAQKAFAAERPFNFVVANDGTLPRQNVEAAIRKYLPEDEQELIRAAGWDKFVAGRERVPVAEARKWLDDNMPKVEVKELFAAQEVDPELLRLQQKEAAIRHKIDTWSAGQSEATRLSWEKQLQDAQNAIRAYNWTHLTEPNDSATARYESVNPRELRDMPGAVDLLVRMPRRKRTEAEIEAEFGKFAKNAGGAVGESVPAILPASKTHYSREGDNLLTHVRAYEHDLPDGRRVLRVFELQSDWAQQRRKVEDQWPNITDMKNLPDGFSYRVQETMDGPEHVLVHKQQGKGFSGDTPEEALNKYTDYRAKVLALDVPDYPLLPHVQRLGIKAAIEHARKRGLDGIVIDDAPTAMMTERHDQVKVNTVSPETVLNLMVGGDENIMVEYHGRDWRDGKYVESDGDYYRVDSPEIYQNSYTQRLAREFAPYHGRDSFYIPQRKGMELAYDKVLPDMAEKITGARGEPVELGPHKNAEYREDFAFTDYKTGKGKTTSTGRLYPIAEPAARRERGEPFSLTGAKYQDARAQQSSPEFKAWFGDWERINELRERQYRGDASVIPEVTRLVAGRSMVVDSVGRPKVMYHGSKRAGFNEFDMERTPELGMHFGSKPQAADFVVKPESKDSVAKWEIDSKPKDMYTAMYLSNPNRADAIYPVYLDIKKPFNAPDLFGPDPGAFANWLVKTKQWDEADRQRYNVSVRDSDYADGWRFIKRWIQSKGYDGIHYVNEHEGRPGEPDNDAWIAFEPGQIKSATGNRGTFDRNNPDIRYQPLETRAVPGSLFAAVERLNPQMSQRLQRFARTQNELLGMFNANTMRHVAQLPEEVRIAAADKRDIEYAGGPAQTYTPQEQAYITLLDDFNAYTRAIANRRGGAAIMHDPHYQAHMISGDWLRRLLSTNTNEREVLIQQSLPEYLAYNAQFARGHFDPAEAETYLRDYVAAISNDMRSSNLDFAALTRRARPYGLPASMRERDPLRMMERYANRWARDVARFETIESDPDAAAFFGIEKDPNTGSHRLLDENVNAARNYLYGNLTPAPGQTALSTMFPAAQRLTHSLIIGPVSATKNLVASVAQNMTSLNLGEALSVPQAYIRALADFNDVRERAMHQNIVRPDNDRYMFQGDLDIMNRVGRVMSTLGQNIRTYTGAEFLETVDRVIAYSVGETKFDYYYPLLARGDADARRFFEMYGAGVDPASPDVDTNRARTAANYAVAIQTSYGAEDLPRRMLDRRSMAYGMRIQRYGVANLNRVRERVLRPAREGNFMPLLTYLATALGVSGPIIQKLNEALNGQDRRPTDVEIETVSETPALEKTLNLMQLADAATLFGVLGTVAGTAAQNYRGGNRAMPFVSEPTVMFGLDGVVGAARLLDAIKSGEDPIDASLMALDEVVLRRVQALRPIMDMADDEQRALNQDRRNKAVLQSLAGDKASFTEMAVNSLGLGRYSRLPMLSPAKERALEGDREAQQFLKETRGMTRADLNNYPGGFEEPRKERALRAFIGETQGPEKLDEYLARRRAFKQRVLGREE